MAVVRALFDGRHSEYGFFGGVTFSHCGVDHMLLVRGDSGTWRILELSDTRRTPGCSRWTAPR